MRLSLRVGFLVLALSLIGSARAEANIWDWLEELNGPGPSRSRGNVMVNIKCSSPSSQLGLFRVSANTETPVTCVFADFRALHAEEDARFYPVTLTITEVGTSVLLHKTFDVGAGAGLMTFSSHNPVTDEDFKGARMTITFPRLAFRPLLAIPWSRFQDPRWRFLQVYFKESIVVGNLNQGDFASKPGVEFGRRHQRVESMGFIIDVIALLGRTG